ncbi:MAG: hypothetical protein LBQ81_04320 [Zoogloeaceae bacterium]|jgi:hypothetical protein|nr:hypothetical protein [Zoogloeaceae bacterium]
MKKHEKPVSRIPCAGLVVEHVRVRSVWVRDEEQVPDRKPGKLDYLGGPARKKPAARHKKRRIELEIRHQGHYIGDGKRLIAFVTDDAAEVEKPLSAQ